MRELFNLQAVASSVQQVAALHIKCNALRARGNNNQHHVKRGAITNSFYPIDVFISPVLFLLSSDDNGLCGGRQTDYFWRL